MFLYLMGEARRAGNDGEKLFDGAEGEGRGAGLEMIMFQAKLSRCWKYFNMNS